MKDYLGLNRHQLKRIEIADYEALNSYVRLRHAQGLGRSLFCNKKCGMLGIDFICNDDISIIEKYKFIDILIKKIKDKPSTKISIEEQRKSARQNTISGN